MAETVAFIGLGAMGLNMAGCLLRGGFSVRGFDVRGDRLEQFGMDGGTVCASSAEAGEGADSALVIVLTADQADEACFGEHGLARSLARGTTITCMTTMSPARSRDLASKAAHSGLHWLDAPVSGGTGRAADGTLTTMIGGEVADLERARPVLDGFSQHIFHLGPVGAGSTASGASGTV